MRILFHKKPTTGAILKVSLGLASLCTIALVSISITYKEHFINSISSKTIRQRRSAWKTQIGNLIGQSLKQKVLKTRSGSAFKKFGKAAVSSDSEVCSGIGAYLLEHRGGSAVDAAIATLLCDGVHSPQSLGIGGGLIFTIYDTPRGGNEKVIETLISREMAAGAAHRDMYVNKSHDSTVGGRAIAVPGEIKGYWDAHQKYGRLPWSELFQHTIEMCRRGIRVSRTLAFSIWLYGDIILETDSLREIFTNGKGELLQEGDAMFRIKLSNTLSTIAEEGESAFYNGSLSRAIVDDIMEEDGIITEKDLENYFTKWNPTVNISLHNGDLEVHAPPLPSSGVLLAYMMNILDGYGINAESINETDNATLTYHRMIESFKFAYAMRSHFGDSDGDPDLDLKQLMQNLTSKTFASYTRSRIHDDRTHNISYYNPDFDSIPEDHGTAHVAVYGPDGSAVSATSTINLLFGSLVRGRRTGILFNNQMDDFSSPNTTNAFGIPSSPNNYIKPGKRPMSSTAPTIIQNGHGDVVLVTGGSGGSRITSATAYTAIHVLWLGMRLDKGLDRSRLHHQLSPNVISHETGFPNDILTGLAKKGHVISESGYLANVYSIQNVCHSNIGADSNVTKCIHAACDARKGGVPVGF